MANSTASGFSVRYEAGFYTIACDAPANHPLLSYSRDPEGAGRRQLCSLEESPLTIPSPLSGERLYFFLETDGHVLMAASRRVEISGVENFRDLGGYPAANGRQVKWGRFFRGGPINGLNEAERTALDQMGIKKVFDYRTQKEHERFLDECPRGAEGIWAPATPPEKRFAEFADRDMLSHLKAVNTPEKAQEEFLLFRDLYAAMPFGSDAFRQMLFTLDREETVPMYQHCSAGKDRTGVGSALLLLALGVSEDVVVEDYLLSRDYRRDINLKRVEKLLEAGISSYAEALILRMMMTGMEELIGAALHAIRLKYPSYEAFFLAEYGIDAARLSRWRGMHTC